MSSRKDSKKNIAGALFTAAMIGCCLLLYFTGGNKQADDIVSITAEETGEAAAEMQAQRAYPSVEVFFERAAEYGLNAQHVVKEGFAPALGYTLYREELKDAELVLSIRNGGVCAFTLTVPVTKDAGELPDDPTPIELSLYEQRIAAAELEEAWLDKGFGALLSALDIIEELTYADRTSMYSMLLKTVEDGKDRDTKAADMVFTASRLEKTDGSFVAVSVGISED